MLTVRSGLLPVILPRRGRPAHQLGASTVPPSSQDSPLEILRYGLLAGERTGESLPGTAVELQQLLLQETDSHMNYCIWRRLRDLGSFPGETDALHVFGVVGKIGMSEGSAMIFGLADGSASMYTSNGGGVIGGGGHESVRTACSRLIQAASPFVARMPLVNDFPYPAAGMFRVTLLTPGGARAVEVSEPEVSSGQHELSSLFMAWNDLVTQLRLTDPDQRRAAAQQAPEHTPTVC